MSDIRQFSLDWQGRKLTIEVGHFADQAMGSCTVRYGDTVVLATAVRSSEPRQGIDYFPLMVDYEERFYAAGKISGSRFIKREGRPSEEAVLTGRMVDRAIRPLFDQTIRVDVQVILTVFSIDEANDPDVVSLLAASTALMLSDIPWQGPLVAVRLAKVDGELVVNPTYEQREKALFEIYVAGKEKEVVMIEAAGKEAPDDDMYQAVEQALQAMKPVLDLVKKAQKDVGKEKVALNPSDLLGKDEHELRQQLLKKAAVLAKGKVEPIFSEPAKDKRKDLEDAFKTEIFEALEKDGHELTEEQKKFLKVELDEMIYEQMRQLILKEGRRPDGRALDEIRPLAVETGLLPRTHGSALFTRGETKALSIVTLGAPGDEQFLDGMEISGKKRYMHHYNMPPYSVGEVRPLRGAGRREIGHGALAEKALMPLLPPKETFPYTIRVVSEIMSSNGSTSQASVCGSSLSLMDAGVPVRTACAGISIGLVVDPAKKDKYTLLTDIQGLEDHAGFMDFKVAGTKDGITAIQLDIKLDGIGLDIVRDTFERAKAARLKILEAMNAVLPEPRKELSPYAPRIETLRIDPEKIGDLIGPGGKTINKIIDETDVSIDIEDDGLVHVTSTQADMMEKALAIIRELIRDIVVGEVYEGTVTQVMKDRFKGNEIGAIVSLGTNRDGMIHISEIDHRRVERISDVLKVGDKVKVQVLEVDKERGRISLSRKALLPREEGDSYGPPRRPGPGFGHGRGQRRDRR